MRTLFASVLALIGLAGPAALGQAQEASKPVAIVSFCGYERFFSRLDLLGKMTGNENLSPGVEATVTLLTGGQGLAGLDTKRPWGAVAELKDGKPVVYGVLPVTDLKALTQIFQQQLGIRDAGEGLYSVEIQDRPMFVKQQGAWAFIATSAEQLKGTLPDPAPAFGDLPEKYLLAVRMNVANVPPEMVAGYWQMVEQKIQEAIQDLPAEAKEAKAAIDRSGEQLHRAVMDTDQFTIGFAIDDQTHSAYLDLLTTAKPGTATAKRYALSKGATSRFAGFADPTALLSGMWSSKMVEEGQANALAMLEMAEPKWIRKLEAEGLPDDVTKQLSKSVHEALDVVKATIKSGKAQGGVAAYYQPTGLTVVLGGAVSDADKLNKILKDLYDLAQREDPSIAQQIKLNVEEFEGLKLHQAQVPLPGDADEQLVKVFGQDMDVALAIGPDSAYAALGRDGMKRLKEVVTKSKAEGEREVPPVRFSVSLAGAANMTADVGEPQQKAQAQLMAALLSQSRGLDHFNLVLTPIDDGARVRLELEEGILKILGTLAQIAAPGIGAPPGAAPQGGKQPF